MGLVPFPTMGTGMSSFWSSPCLLLRRSTKCNYDVVLANRWKMASHKSQLTEQQSFTKMSFSFEKRDSSAVTCIKAASPSGPGEEDNCGALDAVTKLYIAIKNQNVREISDVIGDECRCVCNFFSSFQPFEGKQQVVDFYAQLIRILGNNVHFIIKPTLHDGLSVQVSWRLEWDKTHFPLGKGFSFYICQIYKGKVVIRCELLLHDNASTSWPLAHETKSGQITSFNVEKTEDEDAEKNVEMFMEPLLHIEPLRLKLMPYAMVIVDKISSFTNSNISIKSVMLFICMVVVIALFLKPGVY